MSQTEIYSFGPGKHLRAEQLQCSQTESDLPNEESVNAEALVK